MSRQEFSRKVRAQKSMRSKSKGIKWIETLVSHPLPEECIQWPFSKRKSGYGQIFYQGVRTTSNRLICEMYRGPAPFDGAHSAHNCGNRQCCNPKHISWKTAKENHADKVIHGTQPRGSQTHNAKLSERDVAVIRAKCADGAKLRELSKLYGVGRQTIWDAANRRTWRHVA